MPTPEYQLVRMLCSIRRRRLLDDAVARQIRNVVEEIQGGLKEIAHAVGDTVLLVSLVLDSVV